MAQLSESVVVVKISKLVKDGETLDAMIDADTVTNLEAVLEELVNDPKAMIEVIKADEDGE